jgi:hypothetical protein
MLLERLGKGERRIHSSKAGRQAQVELVNGGSHMGKSTRRVAGAARQIG